MSATADTALTKTIATVVTENKVHPVSKHFTRKEASLKIRLGEVEKLVQVPGKGFIERPSCCPDDGYLYFNGHATLKHCLFRILELNIKDAEHFS